MTVYVSKVSHPLEWCRTCQWFRNLAIASFRRHAGTGAGGTPPASGETPPVNSSFPAPRSGEQWPPLLQSSKGWFCEYLIFWNIFRSSSSNPRLALSYSLVPRFSHHYRCYGAIPICLHTCNEALASYSFSCHPLIRSSFSDAFMTNLLVNRSSYTSKVALYGTAFSWLNCYFLLVYSLLSGTCCHLS